VDRWFGSRPDVTRRGLTGKAEPTSEDLDDFHALVAGIDYPMFVVTTAGGGERGGCLVGFVTQASIRPARLVVCLSKANATFRVAVSADVLVVHFLAAGDEPLAELFGAETGDETDKFARCRWEPGPGGVPVLPQAKGWVAATILERLDAGDHLAFLVEPFVAMAHRPDAPQLGFQQVRDLTPGHRAD
jgi:flavin reductase (DIM6/NTAB) family NADH-FMN oxidoreductase RutF